MAGIDDKIKDEDKPGLSNVSLKALLISIIAHIMVITAFGFVRISRTNLVCKTKPAVTAQLRAVRKLAHTTLTTVKPRVKRLNASSSNININRKIALHQIFGDVSSQAAAHRSGRGRIGDSSTWRMLSLSAGDEPLPRVDSSCDRRSIFYVVDCSGSMKGVFKQVKDMLKKSIAALEQDQHFGIIFFGDGRLFEFDGGRLLHATDHNKRAGYGFIDSIYPAGETNALAALDKVFKVCGSGNFSSSAIYFLTDGFELSGQRADRFSQQIVNLRKRFSPAAKVNTVGFWPQDVDIDILKEIAKQSGGEFVIITEEGF
ncbi:MAG: VWA domain-containing protein [Sedimentisphaerales bacterium]|nr:VWA domain-containing protein [Sedimentisphaerales bacterium]